MLGIKSQKDREFIKNKIKELRIEDKQLRRIYNDQQQQQQQIKHNYFKK